MGRNARKVKGDKREDVKKRVKVREIKSETR